MLANIYLTPEGVVGDKTTFFTLSEDTAFKKELYSYPSMKTRAVSPWTKETPPPEDYYDNIIDDSLEENSFITFYCDSIYWDGNESTMNKTGNGSAESPWRNLFYALDNMSVISKVIDCCYYRIVISGVVNYLCIGWDDRTFSVNGRKVYLDFTNADVLAEYGACDLIIRNSVFINLSIRNISDDIGIIRIVGSKLYNIQIDSSVSVISFTCYNCLGMSRSNVC